MKEQTTDSQGQRIETRIGTLSFTHDFANGYPTKETVGKIYDERDFQRACQAYLWALPMVSAGEMEDVIMQAPGAAYGDILSTGTFLVTNADGSVNLYVGPKAPAGSEKNWIPTVPGKAWFPYFRLYAPTEDHFNRKWILPNFERVQ